MSLVHTNINGPLPLTHPNYCNGPLSLTHPNYCNGPLSLTHPNYCNGPLSLTHPNYCNGEEKVPVYAVLRHMFLVVGRLHSQETKQSEHKQWKNGSQCH